MPEGVEIEAGSFEVLSDERLAIGTRRGEILLVDGAFDEHPQPTYKTYASGLDEVLGMSFKDGAFFVTQQTEVTKITDENEDGKADRFRTLSDEWGFRNYHEFAFGSKLDDEGNIWVALCLSKSYQSDEPFRGWCVKVTQDGRTIPVCSGIRSPCGIGPNEHGVMFYAESQGPWNGSCSLKVLQPGGFMGHPASFRWYDLAEKMTGTLKRPAVELDQDLSDGSGRRARDRLRVARARSAHGPPGQRWPPPRATGRALRAGNPPPAHSQPH